MVASGVVDTVVGATFGATGDSVGAALHPWRVVVRMSRTIICFCFREHIHFTPLL
jgi:hypothetical protein